MCEIIGNISYAGHIGGGLFTGTQSFAHVGLIVLSIHIIYTKGWGMSNFKQNKIR